MDVENPRKNYPKAIFIATVLILCVSILGSLAIAIVVPKDELAIHAGAVQALAVFFSEFHVGWLTPVISVLMTLGSLAWFCAWVSGPPRSLYATVHHGHLPKFYHKLNKHGMPTNIMLVQAIIATILSLAFFFAESMSVAFMILTDLTAQYLLLMYILMFLSAIILKFKCNRATEIAYAIPGGKFGTILLAAMGFATSAISYIIGFFPPTGIGIRNPMAYTAAIVVGNVAAIMLPWMIGGRKSSK
jgi:amino acid transporter